MSIYNTIKNSAKNAITTAARASSPIGSSFYDLYKTGSTAAKAISGANRPSSTPSPQMVSQMNSAAKTQAPFGSFISYYNSPVSSTQKSGNNNGNFGQNSNYTPSPTVASYYSSPTPTVNKPIDDYNAYNSAPTPTQLPDPTTDSSQSGYASSQNTPLSDEFDFKAMREKLGLKDAPTYTPPDMSNYDSEYEKLRQQQATREADIERNLQNELDAIARRANEERRKAETQTENERQSQLSNLYSVGMVNPASSGVSSIGLASQNVLDERKSNIAAFESNEKAAARAKAYGQKTDAFDKAVQMLVQQRDDINKRATEKYGMDRQVWQDAANELSTVMSMWKAGKQLGQEEKDSMQKNISTLLTNFGSGAFGSVDPKELERVEKIAGFPKGSLVGGIKTLKEKEIESKKSGGTGLNLREIDGSLYNIKTDAEGNITPELIVGSTGGSSKELNQLLSPSEAQALGVPYGTTRGQAAQMGITIGNSKNSGRDLTDTQAKLISEGKQIGLSLQPLYDLIDNQSKLFGPIAGRTGGLNPLNTEAQTARAQLKTAAQLVGGYLEGGKLTDQDVPKYEAMLPQLSDTPTVAKNKLNAINNLIDQKQKQYLQDFASAGYNVSGFMNGGNQNSAQNTEISRYASQLKTGEILVQDNQGRIGAIPEKEFDPRQYKRVGQNFNQPLSMGLKGSFEQKYPEGARGGQCGSFARKLVDIPPLGDGLNDKKAWVNKIGVPANSWRQSPQVGDVIITNENPTYGHVAVVNEVLSNGQVRVTESNFKQSERVSHDRIIPLNSSKIYGAIRAPIKQQFYAISPTSRG